MRFNPLQTSVINNSFFRIKGSGSSTTADGKEIKPRELYIDYHGFNIVTKDDNTHYVVNKGSLREEARLYTGRGLRLNKNQNVELDVKHKASIGILATINLNVIKNTSNKEYIFSDKNDKFSLYIKNSILYIKSGQGEYKVLDTLTDKPMSLAINLKPNNTEVFINGVSVMNSTHTVTDYNGSVLVLGHKDNIDLDVVYSNIILLDTVTDNIVRINYRTDINKYLTITNGVSSKDNSDIIGHYPLAEKGNIVFNYANSKINNILEDPIELSNTNKTVTIDVQKNKVHKIIVDVKPYIANSVARVTIDGTEIKIDKEKSITKHILTDNTGKLNIPVIGMGTIVKIKVYSVDATIVNNYDNDCRLKAKNLPYGLQSAVVEYNKYDNSILNTLVATYVARDGFIKYDNTEDHEVRLTDNEMYTIEVYMHNPNPHVKERKLLTLVDSDTLLLGSDSTAYLKSRYDGKDNDYANPTGFDTTDEYRHLLITFKQEGNTATIKSYVNSTLRNTDTVTVGKRDDNLIDKILTSIEDSAYYVKEFRVYKGEPLVQAEVDINYRSCISGLNTPIREMNEITVPRRLLIDLHGLTTKRDNKGDLYIENKGIFEPKLKALGGQGLNLQYGRYDLQLGQDKTFGTLSFIYKKKTDGLICKFLTDVELHSKNGKYFLMSNGTEVDTEIPVTENTVNVVLTYDKAKVKLFVNDSIGISFPVTNKTDSTITLKGGVFNNVILSNKTLTDVDAQKVTANPELLAYPVEFKVKSDILEDKDITAYYPLTEEGNGIIQYVGLERNNIFNPSMVKITTGVSVINDSIKLDGVNGKLGINTDKNGGLYVILVKNKSGDPIELKRTTNTTGVFAPAKELIGKDICGYSFRGDTRPSIIDIKNIDSKQLELELEIFHIETEYVNVSGLRYIPKQLSHGLMIGKYTHIDGFLYTYNKESLTPAFKESYIFELPLTDIMAMKEWTLELYVKASSKLKNARIAPIDYHGINIEGSKYKFGTGYSTNPVTEAIVDNTYDDYVHLVMTLKQVGSDVQVSHYVNGVMVDYDVAKVNGYRNLTIQELFTHNTSGSRYDIRELRFYKGAVLDVNEVNINYRSSKYREPKAEVAAPELDVINPRDLIVDLHNFTTLEDEESTYIENKGTYEPKLRYTGIQGLKLKDTGVNIKPFNLAKHDNFAIHFKYAYLTDADILVFTDENNKKHSLCVNNGTFQIRKDGVLTDLGIKRNYYINRIVHYPKGFIINGQRVSGVIRPTDRSKWTFNLRQGYFSDLYTTMLTNNEADLMHTVNNLPEYAKDTVFIKDGKVESTTGKIIGDYYPLTEEDPAYMIEYANSENKDILKDLNPKLIPNATSSLKDNKLNISVADDAILELDTTDTSGVYLILLDAKDISTVDLFRVGTNGNNPTESRRLFAKDTIGHAFYADGNRSKITIRGRFAGTIRVFKYRANIILGHTPDMRTDAANMRVGVQLHKYRHVKGLLRNYIEKAAYPKMNDGFTFDKKLHLNEKNEYTIEAYFKLPKSNSNVEILSMDKLFGIVAINNHIRFMSNYDTNPGIVKVIQYDSHSYVHLLVTVKETKDKLYIAYYMDGRLIENREVALLKINPIYIKNLFVTTDPHDDFTIRELRIYRGTILSANEAIINYDASVKNNDELDSLDVTDTPIDMENFRIVPNSLGKKIILNEGDAPADNTMVARSGQGLAIPYIRKPIKLDVDADKVTAYFVTLRITDTYGRYEIFRDSAIRLWFDGNNSMQLGVAGKTTSVTRVTISDKLINGRKKLVVGVLWSNPNLFVVVNGKHGFSYSAGGRTLRNTSTVTLMENTMSSPKLNVSVISNALFLKGNSQFKTGHNLGTITKALFDGRDEDLIKFEHGKMKSEFVNEDAITAYIPFVENRDIIHIYKNEYTEPKVLLDKAYHTVKQVSGASMDILQVEDKVRLVNHMPGSKNILSLSKPFDFAKDGSVTVEFEVVAVSGKCTMYAGPYEWVRDIVPNKYKFYTTEAHDGKVLSLHMEEDTRLEYKLRILKEDNYVIYTDKDVVFEDHSLAKAAASKDDELLQRYKYMVDTNDRITDTVENAICINDTVSYTEFNNSININAYHKFNIETVTETDRVPNITGEIISMDRDILVDSSRLDRNVIFDVSGGSTATQVHGKLTSDVRHEFMNVLWKENKKLYMDIITNGKPADKRSSNTEIRDFRFTKLFKGRRYSGLVSNVLVRKFKVTRGKIYTDREALFEYGTLDKEYKKSIISGLEVNETFEQSTQKKLIDLYKFKVETDSRNYNYIKNYGRANTKVILNDSYGMATGYGGILDITKPRKITGKQLSVLFILRPIEFIDGELFKLEALLDKFTLSVENGRFIITVNNEVIKTYRGIDNNPRYMAITRDDLTFKMYVDGEMIFEKTITNTLPDMTYQRLVFFNKSKAIFSQFHVYNMVVKDEYIKEYKEKYGEIITYKNIDGNRRAMVGVDSDHHTYSELKAWTLLPLEVIADNVLDLSEAQFTSTLRTFYPPFQRVTPPEIQGDDFVRSSSQNIWNNGIRLYCTQNYNRRAGLRFKADTNADTMLHLVYYFRNATNKPYKPKLYLSRRDNDTEYLTYLEPHNSDSGSSSVYYTFMMPALKRQGPSAREYILWAHIPAGADFTVGAQASRFDSNQLAVHTINGYGLSAFSMCNNLPFGKPEFHYDGGRKGYHIIYYDDKYLNKDKNILANSSFTLGLSNPLNITKEKSFTIELDVFASSTYKTSDAKINLLEFSNSTNILINLIGKCIFNHEGDDKGNGKSLRFNYNGVISNQFVFTAEYKNEQFYCTMYNNGVKRGDTVKVESVLSESMMITELLNILRFNRRFIRISNYKLYSGRVLTLEEIKENLDKHLKGEEPKEDNKDVDPKLRKLLVDFNGFKIKRNSDKEALLVNKGNSPITAKLSHNQAYTTFASRNRLYIPFTYLDGTNSSISFTMIRHNTASYDKLIEFQGAGWYISIDEYGRIRTGNLYIDTPLNKPVTVTILCKGLTGHIYIDGELKGNTGTGLIRKNVIKGAILLGPASYSHNITFSNLILTNHVFTNEEINQLVNNPEKFLYVTEAGLNSDVLKSISTTRIYAPLSETGNYHVNYAEPDNSRSNVLLDNGYSTNGGVSSVYDHYTGRHGTGKKYKFTSDNYDGVNDKTFNIHIGIHGLSGVDNKYVAVALYTYDEISKLTMTSDRNSSSYYQIGDNIKPGHMTLVLPYQVTNYGQLHFTFRSKKKVVAFDILSAFTVDINKIIRAANYTYSVKQYSKNNYTKNNLQLINYEFSNTGRLKHYHKDTYVGNNVAGLELTEELDILELSGYTVELFIRLQDNKSGITVINTLDKKFLFKQHDGFRVTDRIAGDDNIVEDKIDVDYTKYTHLVYTMSAKDGRAVFGKYINGKLMASEEKSFSKIVDTKIKEIFSVDNNSIGQYFVKEFRIYTGDPLTLDQININYRSALLDLDKYEDKEQHLELNLKDMEVSQDNEYFPLIRNESDSIVKVAPISSAPIRVSGNIFLDLTNSITLDRKNIRLLAVMSLDYIETGTDYIMFGAVSLRYANDYFVLSHRYNTSQTVNIAHIREIGFRPFTLVCDRVGNDYSISINGKKATFTNATTENDGVVRFYNRRGMTQIASILIHENVSGLEKHEDKYFKDVYGYPKINDGQLILGDKVAKNAMLFMAGHDESQFVYRFTKEKYGDIEQLSTTDVKALIGAQNIYGKLETGETECTVSSGNYITFYLKSKINKPGTYVVDISELSGTFQLQVIQDNVATGILSQRTYHNEPTKIVIGDPMDRYRTINYFRFYCTTNVKVTFRVYKLEGDHVAAILPMSNVRENNYRLGYPKSLLSYKKGILHTTSKEYRLHGRNTAMFLSPGAEVYDKKGYALEFNMHYHRVEDTGEINLFKGRKYKGLYIKNKTELVLEFGYNSIFKYDLSRFLNRKLHIVVNVSRIDNIIKPEVYIDNRLQRTIDTIDPDDYVYEPLDDTYLVIMGNNINGYNDIVVDNIKIWNGRTATKEEIRDSYINGRYTDLKKIKQGRELLLDYGNWHAIPDANTRQRMFKNIGNADEADICNFTGGYKRLIYASRRLVIPVKPINRNEYTISFIYRVDFGNVNTQVFYYAGINLYIDSYGNNLRQTNNSNLEITTVKNESHLYTFSVKGNTASVYVDGKLHSNWALASFGPDYNKNIYIGQSSDTVYTRFSNVLVLEDAITAEQAKAQYEDMQNFLYVTDTGFGSKHLPDTNVATYLPLVERGNYVIDYAKDRNIKKLNVHEILSITSTNSNVAMHINSNDNSVTSHITTVDAYSYAVVKLNTIANTNVIYEIDLRSKDYDYISYGYNTNGTGYMVHENSKLPIGKISFMVRNSNGADIYLRIGRKYLKDTAAGMFRISDSYSAENVHLLPNHDAKYQGYDFKHGYKMINTIQSHQREMDGRLLRYVNDSITLNTYQKNFLKRPVDITKHHGYTLELVINMQKDIDVDLLTFVDGRMLRLRYDRIENLTINGIPTGRQDTDIIFPAKSGYRHIIMEMHFDGDQAITKLAIDGERITTPLKVIDNGTPASSNIGKEIERMEYSHFVSSVLTPHEHMKALHDPAIPNNITVKLFKVYSGYLFTDADIETHYIAAKEDPVFDKIIPNKETLLNIQDMKYKMNSDKRIEFINQGVSESKLFPNQLSSVSIGNNTDCLIYGPNYMDSTQTILITFTACDYSKGKIFKVGNYIFYTTFARLVIRYPNGTEQYRALPEKNAIVSLMIAINNTTMHLFINGRSDLINTHSNSTYSRITLFRDGVGPVSYTNMVQIRNSFLDNEKLAKLYADNPYEFVTLEDGKVVGCKDGSIDLDLLSYMPMNNMHGNYIQIFNKIPVGTPKILKTNDYFGKVFNYQADSVIQEDDVLEVVIRTGGYTRFDVRDINGNPGYRAIEVLSAVDVNKPEDDLEYKVYMKYVYAAETSITDLFKGYNIIPIARSASETATEVNSVSIKNIVSGRNIRFRFRFITLDSNNFMSVRFSHTNLNTQTYLGYPLGVLNTDKFGLLKDFKKNNKLIEVRDTVDASIDVKPTIRIVQDIGFTLETRMRVRGTKENDSYTVMNPLFLYKFEGEYGLTFTNNTIELKLSKEMTLQYTLSAKDKREMTHYTFTAKPDNGKVTITFYLNGIKVKDRTIDMDKDICIGITKLLDNNRVKNHAELDIGLLRVHRGVLLEEEIFDNAKVYEVTEDSKISKNNNKGGIDTLLDFTDWKLTRNNSTIVNHGTEEISGLLKTGRLVRTAAKEDVFKIRMNDWNTREFTVSMYIRTDGYARADKIFNIDGDQFYIYINAVGTIWSNGNIKAVIGNKKLVLLTITINGNVETMYVDGVKIGTTTYPKIRTIPTDAYATFGMENYTTGAHVYFANAFILNYAMSEEEAKLQYENPMGTLYVTKSGLGSDFLKYPNNCALYAPLNDNANYHVNYAGDRTLSFHDLPFSNMYSSLSTSVIQVTPRGDNKGFSAKNISSSKQTPYIYFRVYDLPQGHNIVSFSATGVKPRYVAYSKSTSNANTTSVDYSRNEEDGKYRIGMYSDSQYQALYIRISVELEPNKEIVVSMHDIIYARNLTTHPVYYRSWMRSNLFDLAIPNQYHSVTRDENHMLLERHKGALIMNNHNIVKLPNGYVLNKNRNYSIEMFVRFSSNTSQRLTVMKLKGMKDIIVNSGKITRQMNIGIHPEFNTSEITIPTDRYIHLVMTSELSDTKYTYNTYVDAELIHTTSLDVTDANRNTINDVELISILGDNLDKTNINKTGNILREFRIHSGRPMTKEEMLINLDAARLNLLEATEKKDRGTLLDLQSFKGITENGLVQIKNKADNKYKAYDMDTVNLHLMDSVSIARMKKLTNSNKFSIFFTVHRVRATKARTIFLYGSYRMYWRANGEVSLEYSGNSSFNLPIKAKVTGNVMRVALVRNGDNLYAMVNDTELGRKSGINALGSIYFSFYTATSDSTAISPMVIYQDEVDPVYVKNILPIHEEVVDVKDGIVSSTMLGLRSAPKLNYVIPIDNQNNVLQILSNTPSPTPIEKTGAEINSAVYTYNYNSNDNNQDGNTFTRGLNNGGYIRIQVPILLTQDGVINVEVIEADGKIRFARQHQSRTNRSWANYDSDAPLRYSMARGDDSALPYYIYVYNYSGGYSKVTIKVSVVESNNFINVEEGAVYPNYRIPIGINRNRILYKNGLIDSLDNTEYTTGGRSEIKLIPTPRLNDTGHSLEFLCDISKVTDYIKIFEFKNGNGIGVVKDRLFIRLSDTLKITVDTTVDKFKKYIYGVLNVSKRENTTDLYNVDLYINGELVKQLQNVRSQTIENDVSRLLVQQNSNTSIVKSSLLRINNEVMTNDEIIKEYTLIKLRTSDDSRELVLDYDWSLE